MKYKINIGASKIDEDILKNFGIIVGDYNSEFGTFNNCIISEDGIRKLELYNYHYEIIEEIMTTEEALSNYCGARLSNSGLVEREEKEKIQQNLLQTAKDLWKVLNSSEQVTNPESWKIKRRKTLDELYDRISDIEGHIRW